MGLNWYWGIPLACLVGLPWYIEMGMLHGDAFIDTFLGYHNITRFVAPEHAGRTITGSTSSSCWQASIHGAERFRGF